MFRKLLVLSLLVSVFVSCRKDRATIPDPTPTDRIEIKLKDIVWQHLPSPFYHFEYSDSGYITRATYSSGLLLYDVFHADKRIKETRNLVGALKDLIQYTYDAGMVTVIKYINEDGITYKRCFLSYNNSRQLTRMEWELKIDNVGFASHRTVEFSYYPDGNLNELTDQRHPITGHQTAHLITERFENYDQKKNVEAFSLLHRPDEHVVLLPGVVLQKNNPAKNTRGGDGVHYTIDYIYQYNAGGAPLAKKGDMVFTSGPNSGTHFEINVAYTYYE